MKICKQITFLIFSTFLFINQWNFIFYKFSIYYNSFLANEYFTYVRFEFANNIGVTNIHEIMENLVSYFYHRGLPFI